MSENNTRRSVLKKIAATGAVGSSLVASSGTAAADESYSIVFGLESGSDGYATYQVFIPYGGDGEISVQGGSDTEPGDQINPNESRGGVEIYGYLDSSEDNVPDTWFLDNAGTDYEIDKKPDDVWVTDSL